MRCPTLFELPPPPPGKTGWPWTVESPQLHGTMPNGQAWPRISIVTPSYNQGRFIEETIRSVLLQGYPNLEYVVIDGASTDQSVAIIEKYAPWLTYWHSRKDKGQSDAIITGLAHTTSEWANWLNSDDFLTKDALRKVGTAAGNAKPTVDALAFACKMVDADGNVIVDDWRPRIAKGAWSYLGDFTTTPQPATFVRKHLLSLDVSLHYVMDWALHFTLVERSAHAFQGFPDVVASATTHADAKTQRASVSFMPEQIAFLNRYQYRSVWNWLAARRWVFRSKSRHKFKSRPATVAWCVTCALRNPALLLDRFYLGAVRKTVIATRGQKCSI